MVIAASPISGAPISAGTSIVPDAFTDTSSMTTKTPGTVVSAGAGTNPWVNPGNVSASDNIYATCAVSLTATDNDYLEATNLGFSIPPGYTILGVTASYERNTSGTGNVSFNSVMLIKGGVKTGADRGTPGNSFSGSSEATTSFGGSSDLWGNTLTPADVNAANFGVALRGSAQSGTPTFQIDQVTVTVVAAKAIVGPNSGSSATTTGATTSPWVNTGNVFTSDNIRATCTAIGVNANVAALYDFIEDTGFGFAIDPADTIMGVVVEIERLRSGGTVGQFRDDTVQLIIGGTKVGTNKATATNWPTTDAYALYGNGSDLWGLTLTPAQVNAANFGVAIRPVGTTAATDRIAEIDHFRITVYTAETPVTNTFTAPTPTGGVVSGGAATIKTTKRFIASGGVIAGGAATVSKTKRFIPTGGVVSGGAATVKKTKRFLSTGGAVSGGAAATAYVAVGTNVFMYVGVGGVVAGGAGITVFVSAAPTPTTDPRKPYRIVYPIPRAITSDIVRGRLS